MFAELNAVAEIAEIAIRALDTLEVNKVYPLVSARRTRTRWGEKVLIEYLDDEESCSSYLPRRVNEKLLKNGAMLDDFIQQSTSGNAAFKYLGGQYNSMLFIEKNV